MLAKILEMIAWDAIKAAFSGWWAGFTRRKEITDAVKPYQKELEIKNRPAGSDDDVINRL